MSPYAPPRAILRVLSDERLARHAADGSHAAFTVLYDRHARELLASCRTVVRDEDDARDALQSTMLNAWRAIGRRGEAPVRPWLFRIARNEAITVLRRRQSSTELAEELHAATDVHAAAAGRAELARVLGDLDALPRRQREALVLRTLGDRGYDEIARRQDTTPQAVRQSVASARRTLRRGRLAGVLPIPAWLVELLATAGTAGAPALQTGVAKTAVGVTAAVAVLGGGLSSVPAERGGRDVRAALAGAPEARAATPPRTPGAAAPASAAHRVPAAGRPLGTHPGASAAPNLSPTRRAAGDRRREVRTGAPEPEPGAAPPGAGRGHRPEREGRIRDDDRRREGRDGSWWPEARPEPQAWALEARPPRRPRHDGDEPPRPLPEPAPAAQPPGSATPPATPGEDAALLPAPPAAPDGGAAAAGPVQDPSSRP